MDNPNKRIQGTGTGTLHPNARPGEKFVVPPGMMPIVDDPNNRYGYRDSSGREYNWAGGQAWTYRGSGDERSYNLANDPYYLAQVKQQVKPSETQPNTGKSSGAPVGGQAGSPDSSDTVGNMESQSGAPATKYGQGKSQPPPRQQKSLDAPAAPGETLPFQLTTTPTTDAGTFDGGKANVQSPQPTAPAVQIPPMQWDAISRMQPRPVRSSWVEPMTQLRQANIPLPPNPAMVETEQDPWLKRYIRAIFGG